MTLRERINAAQDARREAVEIPEWRIGPDELFIRSMTASELDSFEAENLLIRPGSKDIELNRRNVRARLLVRCLVDPEGKRVYQDNEAEELGERNTTIMQRLFAVAERMNAKTAADIEELAKKS